MRRLTPDAAWAGADGALHGEYSRLPDAPGPTTAHPGLMNRLHDGQQRKARTTTEGRQ